MIDASNGNGLSAINPPHEAPVQDAEATAAPSATVCDPRAQTAYETAESQSVAPVSSKKIEANRRNAQLSTGPRSEAGKAVSRLNATKHGLLSREVVITRGDYQEDPEEYARLLDELTEQFQPDGIAEALEVQKIALAYWRKVRAVRYEHGAIRTRTGTMRDREERKREEVLKKTLLNICPRLERTAGGFKYLIESLENIKQQVLDGRVPRESIDWL